MTNTEATERRATPEEWIALATNSKSLGLHLALNAGRRCYESLDGTTRILEPVEGVTRSHESSPPAAALPSITSPGDAVLAEITKEPPSAVDAEIERVFGGTAQTRGASKQSSVARSSADIVAEASRLGEEG